MALPFPIRPSIGTKVKDINLSDLFLANLALKNRFFKIIFIFKKLLNNIENIDI